MQAITVGHIPRELSRGAHYFIKEGGKITAHVRCTHYKPSPIEQGGLEIDLHLTATHPNQSILITMQEFVAKRNQHYAQKICSSEESRSRITVAQKDVSSDGDSDIDIPPPKSKRPRVIVIDSD